jgi:hypothetical protein
MPCMQTKTVTLAQSPPTEELRDFLAQVHDAIKSSPAWPKDWEPIYTLDDVNVHHSALMTGMGSGER